MRSKEIENREKRIIYLEKELREARGIIEKLSRDLILAKRMHILELRGSALPLKVLENLTWDDLEHLEKSTPLKRGDVLYVINPAGAGRSIGEYLVEKGIKAIVSSKELPNLVYNVLQKGKVPVLYEWEIEVKRVDEFAIVDRKEFEEAVEKRLAEWEEEEKEKQRRKFLQILEEYKIERLRELKKRAEGESN